MPDHSSSSPPLCQTGIDGLDSVLCGGFPKNRLYLVEGDPGVGKTTLALQFLLEGTRNNEPVLYITLSETKEEVQEVARSHGWNLDKIEIFELSAIEQQMKTDTEHTFFHPSEVELNKITKILMEEIDRVKPARIVFDSLSEMRLMAETALRYRRQILTLKQFLAKKQCTVLLLDDRTTEERDDQVRSLAHGVVVLEKAISVYGINRRNVSVEKIRGVRFREGYHEFSIERGGIVIFPRLVAAEHHTEFEAGPISSGIKELDTLLGGGVDRGTSTIIMGPPGTGKSTLSMKHVYEACRRGEHCSYYMFDETIGTMLRRGRSLQMDLEPFLESGLLRIDQIDPAEIVPGELAHRIRRGVEARHDKIVVIDSINGYLNTMPTDQYLNMQLHEMLAYLNQQGIATLLLLAQQGLIGNMQSPVDLTYLADTVLLMRFFEVLGEVKLAISVVKKRSGGHERTIREFRVTANGLEVGHPLTEFQGVLTGVPTFTGGKEQILKS